MSPIDSALRELAGIRSDDDPILSCYLDTRWDDEHQRERVRVTVQDRLRQARAAVRGRAWEPAFLRTCERVERHVEELCRQERDADANGVAIFACEGLGLWRTMTFGQSFRNELAVDETPHLLQLARLADDFEPVIVALVDGGGARVFETVLGEVIGDARIEHEAPTLHKMGGWSQLKFQRHVRHQIERNQKEAAEHVTFLFDEDPRSHVILVGPDRVVASFERLLPERVAEHVVARLPNPRERSDREGRVRDQVMERVLAELRALERRTEDRSVEWAVGEALAGGLAVLGPQDVVLAANEGRVHRLLIEDGFDETGWRCRNCAALGIGASASCGYCGGEAATVDLGQELVRRVLEHDGEVDIMEPRARLHFYDGVAAVLRHRGTGRPAIGYAVEQPAI